MPLTRRTLTPRALEARRSNARQSTGPRTEPGKRRSSMNAWRGGAVRALPLPAQPALGEDPADLDRLVEELSEAYEPANAAERLLVEDLALLRLRKRRNQLAQDGLTLKNLGRLERLRDERRQEAVQESADYPFRAAQAIGLINMEDSPAKFKEVGRLLRIMLDDVELGNFSEEGKQILQSIYGPMPTMRGARVLGNYIRLLASGSRPVPAVDPGAEGGPPDPAALANGREASSDAMPILRFEEISLQACYADLLRALAEEKNQVGAKYQHFLAEHIPSDTAVRHAAMVPAEKEWPRLARQESLIERQIETKTRLLLFTQWVRRSNEARPPYIGNETKPVKHE